MPPFSRVLAACALVLLLLQAGPSRAESSSAKPPRCEAPPDLTRLDQPLSRLAVRLATGKPVIIVAIGSSSTAGAGASSPAAAYPSRLEADLRARFPAVSIGVINRGVNGETARQMLARFGDVAADEPALVLWQVGTNSVLRNHSLVGEAPLIRRGIARLRETGADVVLIEPQYAPKVLAKPDAPAMVEIIRKAAREAGVGVFRRWDIMRKWHDADGLPFETVLAPDGLHMNDWSYACLAKLLAGAIVDAARPSVARAPAQR